MSENDFRFKHIEGYQEVLNHWPFLMEGLEDLNKTTKNGEVVQPEQYLNFHLDVATGYTVGRIILAFSKNWKPLGFISACDNTSKYRSGKSLLVYAVYSNNKATDTAKYAFFQLEKWAREQSYDRIQGYSGRTSGASIRWCRTKFGMDLSKLLFVKHL